MSDSSAKVSEKSRKRPKVRERSGKNQGICVVGNLIVEAQQNYFCCTLFVL